MNHEDLETHLQHQPLRQPPAEWRQAILTAADACRGEVDRSPTRRRSPANREAPQTIPLRQRLRALFWPHPAAWGALATIWLAIAASQFALREPGRAPASTQAAIAPDLPVLIVLQREVLAPAAARVSKASATPDRPRLPQSCIPRRREPVIA